jgi:RNA polymerase sigma-70 factor (ECF subfamily)
MYTAVPTEQVDMTVGHTIVELIRRAQAGDQEAFGTLYDRFVEQLFRYLYAWSSDARLAEQLRRRVGRRRCALARVLFMG